MSAIIHGRKPAASILRDSRTSRADGSGSQRRIPARANTGHAAPIALSASVRRVSGSARYARTSALAEWCQGFLYGLGAGNIPDASRLPGEVGEIVRDFAEITRAGVDGAETEESNESAYAELVEFVRVGVQLLCARHIWGMISE